MVDSVLTFENALRRSFPADRQTCPDMRNGRSILAPCRDYSAAYQTGFAGHDGTQDAGGDSRREQRVVHGMGGCRSSPICQNGCAVMPKS